MTYNGSSPMSGPSMKDSYSSASPQSHFEGDGHDHSGRQYTSSTPNKDYN